MKSNWQTKKLGEIIVENSKSLLRSKGNLVGQFPFFVSGYKVKEIDQFLVDGENIFLPTGGNFFVHYFNGKAAYSTDTWSVKNNSYVEIKYLYYFLVLNQELINSEMFKGAAIRHLQKKDLKSLEISFPPLSEQKKIVKMLDEKMKKVAGAKRLREEALIDTGKILSQTLHEILNQGQWREGTIRDLVDASKKNVIKPGPFGSSLKKEFYVEKGYKIYGQEQVISGDARYGDYYINENKYKELNAFKVSAGDVLISLVGTIGRVLIIPSDFELGIINPRLLKITPDKSKADSKFIAYILKSLTVLRQISHIGHGATMNILNKRIIESIKIKIPPLSEQQKIVKRLDALSEKVRQMIELQKSQLADFKKLEKAYLREAFNGELK